jgi:NAD(P)H-hydrate epimerase
MSHLSVAQARELDRRAREEFRIPALILMEHAGRAVAEQAARLGRSHVVVAGSGHNGGDGLVAARLLHLRGHRVRVLPIAPLDRLQGEPAVQARMVEALKIPLVSDLRGSIVIDAIFGIGLNRDVAGPAAEWIDRINRSGKPVVAVDIPSGLDGDTGEPRGAAVRATLTVTFGFPKIGFRRARAKQYLGRLVVADIGYPRELG